MLRLAMTLPAGAFLQRYQALAAPHQGKVKITAIKAMALKNIAGNCLIRIDTDAGITGYGEAGSSGPMARGRIQIMQPMLLGKDPLLSQVTQDWLDQFERVQCMLRLSARLRQVHND